MAFPSWEDLWLHEATALRRILPRFLLGDAPLTVLCYQPAAGDRLIYLQDRDDPDTPIALPPGLRARGLLYNVGREVPWRSELHPMTDDVARAYQENLKSDENTKKRIFDEEQRRYSPEVFDDSKQHLRADKSYRLQSVFPSPLFHDTVQWGTRLPRLGIAYTLDEELGKDKTISEAEQLDIREKLLLIGGINAGNRILKMRLALIMEQSPDHTTRETPDSLSAEVVANALCTTNIGERSERWDGALHVIAKLILGHHTFYPQSPVALHIFRDLGRDPGDVLSLHGWEPWQHEFPENFALKSAFDELVTDLMFLVRALFQWEHLVNFDERTSTNRLRTKIRKLALEALGLLCGKCDGGFKKQYWSVVPPRPLLEIGPVVVPGYPDNTIKLMIKDKAQPEGYDAYLKMLTPVGERFEPANLHNIDHQEIRFSKSGSPVFLKKGKSDWVGKYVRARIALAELEKTKALKAGPAEPQTSQESTDAPTHP